MAIRILLFLLLPFKWRVLAYEIPTNLDTLSNNVLLKENFILVIFNSSKRYHLYFLSGEYNHEPITNDCSIPYEHPELNIYSFSALTMKSKSKTVSLVQIAENTTSNYIVLSHVTFNVSQGCDKINVTMINTVVWQYEHQNYMLLKVDPQEKYAYVVTDSFILSYDLSTNKVDQFNRTRCKFFSSYHSYRKSKSSLNQEDVIPVAFDLTNKWAVMVGYHLVQNISQGVPYYYIIQLRPLSLQSASFLNPIGVDTSEINADNPKYDLSVSINRLETLVAIREARSNEVILLTGNGSATRHPFYQIRSLYFTESGIGDVRSVAWLDDRDTLAVLLVKEEKTTMQLKPEIHVFKNMSSLADSVDPQLDFILPNNQQTSVVGLFSLKFPFPSILAWSNSLLILDNETINYIPSADAGLYSAYPTVYEPPFLYMTSRPCVSGSYKDTPGIGPCTVCPPGTKNLGDKPATQCEACKPESFCPLGASDEIDLTHFWSYNQTFEYPDSPIIDDYDDLLVRKFFPMDMKIECIVYSPLFWTALSITITFFVWLVMFLMKIRHPTGIGIHRNWAKRFLKNIDFIGEGERLVGGLASLVILIIVIYTFWFGNDYLNSYPIEEVNMTHRFCKDNLTNTKFENGLQLPLPKAGGSYSRIFQMLDEQNLSMTVHLINTGAQYTDIHVYRIKHMGTHKEIDKKNNCTSSDSTVTKSFCFNLLPHIDAVQVTIIGPYFIGALRLCLYGESSSDEGDGAQYKRQNLDVCTLFYTDNETIGISTDFSVHLIKVINVTEPLKDDNDTIYHGRWAPYIKYDNDLSDKYYFEKDGQHLRYTSNATTFTVRLSEELYFLENNQSPIIRRYELYFHTFLFIFLIVDIFTMIFALYKLWCQPLLRRLAKCRKNLLEHELQSSHTETAIDPLLQIPRSSEPQLPLIAESTNDQSTKNLECNLAITTDKDVQRHNRIKSAVKASTASATTEYSGSPSSQSTVQSPRRWTTSSTTETVPSSYHLAVERSFEYFNKLFAAHAEKMERLSSDNANMVNQIDELNREITKLKQRLDNICQDQKG